MELNPADSVEIASLVKENPYSSAVLLNPLLSLFIISAICPILVIVYSFESLLFEPLAKARTVVY